jgi:hypothetical protein
VTPLECISIIFLLIGGIFAVNKRMGNWKWRLNCLILYFIGDLALTIFGSINELWSIVIIQIIFQLINIYGIYDCFKQRNEKK